MSDPLDSTRLVLPADGQRSYSELREAFREANRQRIRAMTRPDDIAVCVGIDPDGNPIWKRNSISALRTTAAEGHIHSGFNPQAGRLATPLYTGVIPPVENMPEEFRVVEGAGLSRELRDLARDAVALALHEGVIYPEEAQDYLDKYLKDDPNDNPEGTTTNAETADEREADEHGPTT